MQTYVAIHHLKEPSLLLLKLGDWVRLCSDQEEMEYIPASNIRDAVLTRPSMQ